MNAVVNIAKRSKTTTGEWCEDGSLIGIEDIERQFCVDLPVHTFDDNFHRMAIIKSQFPTL